MKLVVLCVILFCILIITCSLKAYKIETYEHFQTVLDYNDTYQYSAWNFLKSKGYTVDKYTLEQKKMILLLRTGMYIRYMDDKSELWPGNSVVVPLASVRLFEKNGYSLTAGLSSITETPRNVLPNGMMINLDLVSESAFKAFLDYLFKAFSSDLTNVINELQTRKNNLDIDISNLHKWIAEAQQYITSNTEENVKNTADVENTRVPSFEPSGWPYESTDIFSQDCGGSLKQCFDPNSECGLTNKVYLPKNRAIRYNNDMVLQALGANVDDQINRMNQTANNLTSMINEFNNKQGYASANQPQPPPPPPPPAPLPVAAAPGVFVFKSGKPVQQTAFHTPPRVYVQPPVIQTKPMRRRRVKKRPPPPPPPPPRRHVGFVGGVKNLLRKLRKR